MSWKSALSFTFVLFVVVLLTLYWVLPLGQVIEFGVSDPGHSNFILNDSLNGEMQFYENLRYKTSNISYSLGECSIQKTDEINRALDFLTNSTVLDFYKVNEDSEIEVTCEDTVTRGEKGAFIAGEGGVTKVRPSGEFNVIYEGKVLLIRETQRCPDPLVGIHELLHALGFDHSDNPNNVMYPTIRCGQTLGDDIADYIEWIYSFPNLPDLTIENASASAQGRYIDLSLTVKNNGLKDAEESRLIIYADGKEIRDFNIDPIEIGGGRTITLTNIPLQFTQRTVQEEIELFIDYDFEELDKGNNRVTLKIKNTE